MLMRPLTGADLPVILPWRNHPDVRRNMYSPHVISEDEHQAWFAVVKQDKSRLYYMVEEQGQGVGVVYYTDIRPARRGAFWGFYLAPDAPQGSSIRLEYAALEHAFSELQLHKLDCEVIGFNKVVINMHKKAGFIEEGCFRDYHFDGADFHPVIRLGMTKAEWDTHRIRLSQRIASMDRPKG